MATSPPTSALGTLGDIARPSASKSAGKAPVKSGDKPEKSSFSDVLQGARNDRPEPQSRSAADPKPREKMVAERGNVVTGRDKTTAATATQAAAKPDQTGKALPPDGEELPAPATVEDLLAGLAAEASDGKLATGEDEGAEVAVPDATPPPTAQQPAVPIVPVMPENNITGSAAALAVRNQTGTSDDAQSDITKGVDDATTSQKREIPTTAQTLTAAVPLSEIIPGAAPATETAATAAVAAAAAKPVPAKTIAADDADAETDAAAIAAALVATKGGTETADAATVTDAAAIPGDGLTLDRQSLRRLDFKAGEQGAALTITDDGSPSSAALVDGGAIGVNVKATGDAERASFRDTLKQIDTTLGAPATRGNDAAPVTNARDNGLRQYLDSSVTNAKVDVPVGKQGWSDAVAGKVMWMSSQNLSSAEIQLNPPDLGPMSVRVSSHQDQTSVYFTSNHAQVREALDQSLPRLREMMGNQGIQLLDVGVGGQGSMRDQQAFANHGGHGNGGNSRGGGSAGETLGDAELGSVTRTSTLRAQPGLLDAYA